MSENRRESDRYGFLRRNQSVLMWLAGLVVAGLMGYAHLEQHVTDLQRDIDRIESRQHYMWGRAN